MDTHARRHGPLPRGKGLKGRWGRRRFARCLPHLVHASCCRSAGSSPAVGRRALIWEIRANSLPHGIPIESSSLQRPRPNRPQHHLDTARQIPDWLAEVLPAGARVGIDPFCHTVDAVRSLTSKLQVGSKRICLICVSMHVWVLALACARARMHTCTRTNARVYMHTHKVKQSHAPHKHTLNLLLSLSCRSHAQTHPITRAGARQGARASAG